MNLKTESLLVHEFVVDELEARILVTDRLLKCRNLQSLCWIFCSGDAGCWVTPCRENILFRCVFAVLFMFLMLCMKYMKASPFFVIGMLLPPERDRRIFALWKLAVVGANEKPEFIALFATSLIYICKLGWSPKHQFISISYFLVC